MDPIHEFSGNRLGLYRLNGFLGRNPHLRTYKLWKIVNEYEIGVKLAHSV